jgi:hypothetical protein
MSRARQALALILLGTVAGSVGYAGASVLERSSEPPAPRPAAQAAAPEAAAPVTTPAPAPAPAVPVAPSEPAAPPEAPGPPPAAEEPAVPRPRAPRPAPAPAPAPEREPPPATTAGPATTAPPPVTAPAAPEAPGPPSGPPASALGPPPDPPTGVAIPPETALTGADPAHRVLAAALAAAAPGSVERSDLARSLALWRTYVGPDAESVPAGRRATVARALRANAWWFRDRGSPRSRVLLRDEDGVILTYRAGQGFAVNPVATTGRWRDLNDDVPAAALAGALLEMGVERRAGERPFSAWEYYDVADDPAAIVPGTSGMAQARVALTMAHAQAETGDPRFAAAALGALAAFTADVGGGGVRSMVRTAPGQPLTPWYVERAYPGDDPWKGGALNGFMVTLLNLRGTAAILDAAPGGGEPATAAAALARDLADRGARSLERHLSDHDTGSWSLYGLLTPGRPWRTYLADLNYHCYHVRLLTDLAAAYPAAGFAETADRWQGYVDDAGLTCPAREAARA